MAKKRALPIVKKAVVLPAVGKGNRAMQKSSGILIYWLSLLILVVLNIFVAFIIAVLLLAIKSGQVLWLVAALGFFFGHVSNRLVNFVENLEIRHHFFAYVFLPVVAAINLFIVSSATNNFAEAIRFGYVHSPLLVSLSYGVAFILPTVGMFIIRAYTERKVGSTANTST